MKPDRGDMAEDFARDLATRAGFIVNAPNRDRKGWDQIWEVSPDPQRKVSADMRPGTTRCLIQVKGVGGDVDGVDVKLSVWESLVKEPNPCFFLVARYNKSDKPVEVFLIPVAGAWIERALKRLRQMGENEKAYDKTLRLTWGPEDRLKTICAKSLRNKLLAHTGDDPTRYVVDKTKFVNTCGFPNRRCHGHFKFKASSLEDGCRLLQLAKLGKMPLDAVEIEVSESRFDIDIPIDGITCPGSIAWASNVRGVLTAENELKDRVELPCDVFTAKYLPDKMDFRVAASGFDLMCINNPDSTAQLKIDWEPLSQGHPDAAAHGKLMSILDDAGLVPVTITLPEILGSIKIEFGPN